MIKIQQSNCTDFLTSVNNKSCLNTDLTQDHLNIVWLYLLLVTVILFTLIGNSMVIMAVITNKNLQTTTNYFLTSLAVADLLVAAVVMPIQMLTETLGYFPFGFLMCNIWSSSDICLCTSSIWHMSTISMDRYFTIKFPLKYGRNKSRKYACLKIALVWLISVVICSFMFILGMANSLNVYDPVLKVCAPTNRSFKIYGSIFAFFIPFFILIYTHALTVRALKKLMKSKKKFLMQTMINYDANARNNNTNNCESENFERHRRVSRLLTTSMISMKQILNDKFTHEYLIEKLNQEKKSASSKKFSIDLSVKSGNITPAEERLIKTMPRELTKSCLNTKINSLNTSENLLSSKIFFSKTSPAEGKTFRKKRYDRNFTNFSQPVSNKANNERKAQKVLIIMFITFVTAWLPFFLFNIMSAICEPCISDLVTSNVISLITWLGYLASMANPIIYTMFNKKFRIAFHHLARCKSVSYLYQDRSFRSVNNI